MFKYIGSIKPANHTINLVYKNGLSDFFILYKLLMDNIFI